MESSSYDIDARYYDAAYEAKEDVGADIGFYRGLAVASGGPVLEVACGTGRVLLEIARAGVPIEGLDRSRPLLAILHRKLETLPDDVRKRVTVHEGDMRSFSLGRRFPLVIVPFRPLQHLHTVEDQISTFDRLRRHVAAGGRLAFDVFFPRYDLLEDVDREEMDLEFPDPEDPSLTVRRFFRRTRLDRVNQFFDGEFTYRTYRGKELVREEKSPLRMTYYTYPHLLLLLERSGLEVEAEYGSFEKEGLDVRKDIVIVARERGGSR